MIGNVNLQLAKVVSNLMLTAPAPAGASTAFEDALNALSPEQKDLLIDTLILDDFVGYTQASFLKELTGLAGVTAGTEDLENALMGNDSKYVDKYGDAARKKSTLIKKMDEEIANDPTLQDAFNTLKNILTTVEEKGDLKQAVAELNAKGLTAEQMQFLRDRLILDDFLGYTQASFLSRLVGLSGVIAASEDLENALMGNDSKYVDKYGDAARTKSGLITKLVAEIAADPNMKVVYDTLKTQLDKLEDKIDLRATLCVIDEAKPFCVVINNVTTNPEEAKQGKEVEVKLEGLFPKDPKVEFVLNNTAVGEDVIKVEGDLTLSADKKTLTFKIKIADDATVAKYDVKVSSAGYGKLAAVKPEGLDVKPGKITIDQVIPHVFVPGDQVDKIEIIGKDLDRVDSIDLADLFAGLDANQTEITPTKITISGMVIIPEDLEFPEGYGYISVDLTFKDSNDEILGTAPLTIFDPGDPRLSETVEKLNIEAKAGAGYFDPDPKQPEFEKPTYDLKLGVNPHILGEKEDALVENEHVDLEANAYGTLSQNVNLDGVDDTVLGGWGLGAKLRWKAHPMAQPEIALQYDGNYASYLNPNHQFFNGS
ncbi:MAG: hypothetical protein ABIH76_02380, partial [Candidatus Bathyarchaeota archaeon]